MGSAPKRASDGGPSSRDASLVAEELRSPFHAGERFIHARLGDAERTERRGQQMIRSEMPAQHRDFFAFLPFLVLATADEQGQLWAELLTGAPGFVTSPDPRSLHIEIAKLTDGGEGSRLREGAPVGLLGIELATRRRNRANGHVRATTAGGVSVDILQSFGNCPKYIIPRAPAEQEWLPLAGASPREREGARLSAEAVAVLRNTDTCFVASASGDPIGEVLTAPGGLDVSHRGGPPGFLHVTEHRGGTRVTMPDYSGNQMFNTLGNLLSYRHAGLLALDFSSQRLLSLSGRTEIEWEGPAVDAFPGAERLWHLDVESAWLSPSLLPTIAP